MSWGFVPVTKYQEGDETAVLEPLSEQLKDYEQLMMQYYGAGVQACYRGLRFYNTQPSGLLVEKTIHWYKKYRSILNTAMIQLRRAYEKNWDGFLPVNFLQKQKGLLMLYNPLKQKITRNIYVPPYYTGLTDAAVVKIGDSYPLLIKLNRNYEIELTISIDPERYNWVIIE